MMWSEENKRDVYANVMEDLNDNYDGPTKEALSTFCLIRSNNSMKATRGLIDEWYITQPRTHMSLPYLRVGLSLLTFGFLLPMIWVATFVWIPFKTYIKEGDHGFDAALAVCMILTFHVNVLIELMLSRVRLHRRGYRWEQTPVLPTRKQG